MLLVGGANKISVLSTNLVHQHTEITMGAINIGFGVKTRRLSLSGNFITMFIGPNLKAHLMATLALVTGPYIG